MKITVDVKCISSSILHQLVNTMCPQRYRIYINEDFLANETDTYRGKIINHRNAQCPKNSFKVSDERILEIINM